MIQIMFYIRFNSNLCLEINLLKSFKRSTLKVYINEFSIIPIMESYLVFVINHVPKVGVRVLSGVK